MTFLIAATLAVACAPSERKDDQEATIAVAANFTATAMEIGEAFREATGRDIIFSFASTGKLYAQIAQGAPFDVFLAADERTPALCIAEGHCVDGSAFAYATGRLALWSRDPDRALDENALSAPFDRLAIANPATAPYGVAALQTLDALGAAEAVKGRIVQGDSIAQTYQFLFTGAADLSFIALSQLTHTEGETPPRYWLVPQDLHDPLRQDAALTTHGADNDTAKAFLAFMQGPEARAIIERFGYALEE